MTNIDRFTSISEILNLFLKMKKQKNKYTSIRSWAKEIGMSSPGALSEILAGKRNLPSKFTSSVIKEFELSALEELYFRRLQEKEEIQSSKNFKVSVMESLDSFVGIVKSKIRKTISVSDDLILGNPIFFISKCLYATNRPSFQVINFSTLRSYLTKDIEDGVIRQGCNNLSKRQNFLSERKSVTNKVDISSQSVQRTHRFFLDLAKKRIASVPVASREFNNFTLIIDKADIPDIKKRYRDFFNLLLVEFNSSNSDSAYQLGGYFYPLKDEI